LSASSRGDFEEAFGHASTIGPPGDLSRDTPQVLWVLLDLVESAMRTGRRAAASAHVAAIRSASVESISPRLALVSTGCAALTAAGDEARGLFEQAVSTPGAERWPFDLGRVLLAYGEHLRRSRASEEAHGHLVAAVDLFERLGARPWASRAAEQVRAMGRTTAHAAVPATEVLTPQELHIAQLAASGLTNRQIAERLFVSHRTIGAHLYRIYPKLGVTSRAALRDALSSRT
jgi:DNA-binding CsgD family transcriptional regulator